METLTLIVTHLDSIMDRHAAAMLLSLLAMVLAIVGSTWIYLKCLSHHEHRLSLELALLKTETEASLKQQMLSQGMSAIEIAQVLESQLSPHRLNF